MNADNVMVDITLYELNQDEETNELAKLASDIPNSGSAKVAIPNLHDVVGSEIHPVGIFVSLSTSWLTQVVDSVISLGNISSQNLIGLWSGAAYLAESSSFRSRCEEWYHDQETDIGDMILSRIRDYPCPRSLDSALQPNSGFQEEKFSSYIYGPAVVDELRKSFFHPGACRCFLQAAGFE